MTAVDEDKILTRNPCRIRGAGNEKTPERPVLTVAQVYDLAGRLGGRPVGNIRRLPNGTYRLHYRCQGEVRLAPKQYLTRSDAEEARWDLSDQGRADNSHDHRYRALVLLATFGLVARRWPNDSLRA